MAGSGGLSQIERINVRSFFGKTPLDKKLEKTKGLLLTVAIILDTINSTAEIPHSPCHALVAKGLIIHEVNGLFCQGFPPIFSIP